MIDLISFIYNYIGEHFPNKYNFTYPNQKYNLKTIINDLMYVLKTGLSWRDYRGSINWHTLYHHFCFFRDNDIFKNVYIHMLNHYYKYNKTSKLKYQIVDSSFIQNQFGVDKIGRNKYFKNKKVTKLSIVTDVNGIPISVLLDKGNVHDSQFIEKHLNDFLIVTKTYEYRNFNKYKQYMLADAGYDSANVQNLLIQKGYVPIIAHNRRNTKDPSKIKKFNKLQKCKYKKRIIVENAFSWIKKNKRLLMRFDKLSTSYLSFVYLALTKIIFRYF